MAKVFDLEAYAKKAREAVSEGIVMLKNEKETLPLKKGSKVAVFGRNQFSYYKSGTGSGGAVNTGNIVDVLKALSGEEIVINQAVKAEYEKWLVDHPFDDGCGWASEPWFQEEMPLSEAFVKQAAKESDTALILLGRTAGEDKDNKGEAGSYYLTETEEQMLALVCKEFEKTAVLLNVGNIIDMKWAEKYQPQAVLYIWQGGQEGGKGTADVLMGRVSPSGKLTDTIARDLADYPAHGHFGDETRNEYEEDIYVGYRYFETFAKDEVVYPFGFGLSYTTFEIQAEGVEELEDAVRFTAAVVNTGKTAGKEVVQVYCEAPQGKLGKPSRSLIGFAKTACLAPGERTQVVIECPNDTMASYDDSGVTGHKSCYVLEEGEYAFYVGSDVRSAKKAGRIVRNTLQVVEQLGEAMAPVVPLRRMKPEECGEGYRITYEKAPMRTYELKERVEAGRTKELAYTGDRGIKLLDVAEGKASMDEFIAQLSDHDLCCIVRGEGMCSPKVTPGTAAAFGGVTESLKAFGIPTACCADGPSGIRMDCGTIAFSMPNGTCLGSSFNEELARELYEFEGLELRKNKIDTLLGPGMNIHRHPLNGRNFEYFSEDPLLTGKMAAAQLKGMQRYQVTGTIKHFACNSQEFHRHDVEAVVSERALREIYLKAFEIAVKEGGAYSLMTSYNPINGLWTASNYDLLTTILRGEWGYRGLVMTDWWAKANDEGQPADRRNVAAMVRSQNDVSMVTRDADTNTSGDNSDECLANGTASRADYQRCAANLCGVLMRMPAFQRLNGQEDELDKALAQYAKEEEGADGEVALVRIEDREELDPSFIRAEKGKNSIFQIIAPFRRRHKLTLTVRSTAESDLAQLPFSVFINRELKTTITLEGKDREWNTIEIDLGFMEGNNYYLKFYFAQSGLVIRNVSLDCSSEERE